MVYALNKDGHLYALDVETGDLVWKYNGSGPLFFTGNPVVADGKVYATTGQNASYDPAKGANCDSEFVCLDAYSGGVIWKLPIEAFPPRESTCIAYGNLYLIPAYIKELEMDDYYIIDEVWAIGASRGWPMWRHDAAHSAAGQSGPTNLTLRWKFTAEGAVVSSPSVVDGRVYFGSEDKNVYCVDARTGSLFWKFNTSGRILSSPAVVDGRVYVGPDDGNVYCIDAYTGSLVWSTDAGGFVQAHFSSAVVLRSSPTVLDGRVYVGSLDRNVYCLDADDGDVRWTFKTDGYITSSPAVADGVLYVTSDQRGIYVMNASDGAKLGWFGTASNSWSSATIYKGKAYVGNNDWNVYCISDTPRLTSTVTFDLSKSPVVLGDSVNGSGFLVPGKPDARVSVFFISPDGVVDDLQVVTAKRGAFNFTYTPSATGNWTVTAVWDSDKDYWDSAHSLHTDLDVVTPEPPPK